MLSFISSFSTWLGTHRNWNIEKKLGWKELLWRVDWPLFGAEKIPATNRHSEQSALFYLAMSASHDSKKRKSKSESIEPIEIESDPAPDTASKSKQSKKTKKEVEIETETQNDKLRFTAIVIGGTGAVGRVRIKFIIHLTVFELINDERNLQNKLQS